MYKHPMIANRYAHWEEKSFVFDLLQSDKMKGTAIRILIPVN